MSTELYDAKQMADEIHEAAKVPESLNDWAYTMTMQHLANLIREMDARGMTMSEQRTRMGRKKDELIRDLIVLRENGVTKTENEEPRKAIPVRRMKMDHVRRAG